MTARRKRRVARSPAPMSSPLPDDGRQGFVELAGVFFMISPRVDVRHGADIEECPKTAQPLQIFRADLVRSRHPQANGLGELTNGGPPADDGSSVACVLS